MDKGNCVSGLVLEKTAQPGHNLLFRQHARKMVNDLAFVEEVHGRQAADAEVLAQPFGLIDIYPVKTHGGLEFKGKVFDDAVHNGALSQPLGREHYQEREVVFLMDDLVKLLFVNSRVYQFSIQERSI